MLLNWGICITDAKCRDASIYRLHVRKSKIRPQRDLQRLLIGSTRFQEDWPVDKACEGSLVFDLRFTLWVMWPGIGTVATVWFVESIEIISIVYKIMCKISKSLVHIWKLLKGFQVFTFDLISGHVSRNWKLSHHGICRPLRGKGFHFFDLSPNFWVTWRCFEKYRSNNGW